MTEPSLPPSDLVPLGVSHHQRVWLGDQSSVPKTASFELQFSDRLEKEIAGLEVSEAGRAQYCHDCLLAHEHHVSPGSDLDT